MFRINKVDAKILCFSMFLSICMQMTDVTIGGLKVGEFVMLGMLPFVMIFSYKIKFVFLYVFVFCAFLLAVTFFVNFHTDFYTPINVTSLLKQPYFISISRFVEMISIVGFLLLYARFKKWNDHIPEIDLKLIQGVILSNVLIGLVLIFAALLDILNVADLPICYGKTHRLRAFYVEGGPFGLYCAFLFGLTLMLARKKVFPSFVFLLLIVLAQSKAGFMAAFVFFTFKIWLSFKSRYIKSLIIVILLVSIPLVFLKISANYISDYMNIEATLAKRSNDPNLIMGRVAGSFILPNMIAAHPFLGIGWGNYSLLRNDPKYRNFFPEVQSWDLTGLGGLYTLLSESGIIGVLAFFALLAFISKRTQMNLYGFILFTVPMIFGVQLYFLYPWLIIAYFGTRNIPSQEIALIKKPQV